MLICNQPQRHLHMTCMHTYRFLGVSTVQNVRVLNHPNVTVYSELAGISSNTINLQSVGQVSSEQNLGYLLYIGDYTTHDIGIKICRCRDPDKPIWFLNVFDGMSCQGFVAVAQVKRLDILVVSYLIVQGRPLRFISRFITPLVGVITPVPHLFSAIQKG